MRLLAAALALLLAGGGTLAAGQSAPSDGVVRHPVGVAGGGTLYEGPLRFHYWPGGGRLARYLAGLVRGFSRLPGLPDSVLGRGSPVEIYLAPDPARWDSLTGGGAPDWSAGVAAPSEGRIVLPIFGGRTQPGDIGETLRHELAHIALHRYLAPYRVPRWFDEGYATWASGGMDEHAAWMLRLAFLLHRAPPLDSLELRWPADATRARVAYLLSASAVSLLGEQANGRGMTLLLASWRRTGTLDLALRRTFGLTLGQFEREWREQVGRRYGWPLLLSDSLVFWLLMAPLLVILYLVRRARDRERLASLRASEPPDAPAYWLEPQPDPQPDPQPPGSQPPPGDDTP